MRTERQREFLEAAMSIVAADGFSRLTIRNVAAVIGVTEPAVYRHFASKLALLTAMLEDLQAAIVPIFRKLAGKEDTLRDNLGAFILALFEEMKNHPSFAPFIFSEDLFHTEPQMKPLVSRVMKENLAILSDSFEILQERGICRSDLPAPELALTTMGCIRLTVSRRHLSDGTYRLTELAERLTETLSVLFRPPEAGR